MGTACSATRRTRLAVVVDASLAVALVLQTPYSDRAEELWYGWSADGVDVFAPDLWAYEVASALQQAVTVAGMPTHEAERRLLTVMNLGIHLVPPSVELGQAALRWVDRLGSAAAYDAQYLALAERLQTDFWTRNPQLRDAALWVHYLM